MQGQNGPLPQGQALNYFSNILIDSNLVVRQTDPNNPFPTYLQGIDAFDEDWTNVTVTNNVVITSACHGITFSSIHNGLIANNTVVHDGLYPTPGCVAAVEAGGQTHQGQVTTNTIVRNNLTSQLNVDTRNGGVSADHNVVMAGFSPGISWYVNGAVQFLGTPGTYMNANIINSGGASTQFLNFNPAKLTYTVLLKSTGLARSAGAAGAPATDIIGYTRTAPYASELTVTHIKRDLSRVSQRNALSVGASGRAQAALCLVRLYSRSHCVRGTRSVRTRGDRGRFDR